jgi:hypothetical protein
MSATGGEEAALVQSSPGEGVFDLRLLFREAWRWKWIVILVVLLGAAKGVNDARHFSPVYEAQMTIMPAAEENVGVSSGGGGLLNAAQSFGLIRTGGGAATSFDHFKQTIGSRGLADVLQQKHGLLQRVFKGSWDATNNNWIEPNIDETSFRWRMKRFFHYNLPQVPDRGTLADYVGGAVQVEDIEGSPFFRVYVRHPNRDFALYLLEIVYKEADALLGARDRHKQIRNRTYLEAQLETVQLAEVRSALLAMLMQQEQKAMLVNAEPPYTIKVLEAPWVAKQPNEPKLSRIIAVPIAIAVALCLVTVAIAASFRLE